MNTLQKRKVQYTLVLLGFTKFNPTYAANAKLSKDAAKRMLTQLSACCEKFLFMTGCRTGEAIALQWKHISPDCKTITFCESVSTQLKIRKDCKTYKSRVFPCNESLQALLRSHQPESYDAESLVFPGKRGNVISSKTFLENAWKGRSDREDGIVMKLAREGKIRRYRTQYNTRHTFITHCLEAGVSVVQVTRWVGNSPEIIMKHYAGTIKQVQVPEF